MQDRLKIENMLTEIKNELSSQLHGTPFDVLLSLSCTSAVDLSGLEDERYGLTIKIFILGTYDKQIDIPKKHAKDDKFIKLFIMGEICRYFDLIKMSLEKTNEVIFKYQHELVKEWETNEKVEE